METTPDIDPEETGEWLDALEAVIDAEGVDRAHFLLEKLIDKARLRGAYLPYNANTPYVNTIPVDRQPHYPGDREIERRISSIIRWNALAMVVRGQQGIHPSWAAISRASSPPRRSTTSASDISGARRPPSHGGDLIYIQGHSSPGIYARAFVEGRLTEAAAAAISARKSIGHGLSSYPHPWLMPDFWQFPTVSMGLGPIMAIYQARFMKYLEGRGLADMGDRKVWAFMGDGEMDEPESLGAISLGRAREARQPDLRGQLQPAAPRRSGARQRQDYPGTRGRFPRRRMERHQGHLGQQLGCAAGARQARACCASAWKNASTASTRPSRRATAPTCARSFSRSILS